MPVRVETMVQSLTDRSVRLLLAFTSVPPERFRTVRLFDAFGSPVAIAQPGGCVSHWEAVTPLLSREVLPLTIEATGCDGAPDTPRGFNPPILPSLMTMPELDPGVGGVSCLVLCDDNVACNAAVAVATIVGDALAIACDDWRRTRDRADEREREGATMVAIGVALFIIGALFLFAGWAGILIGAILILVAINLIDQGLKALAEARALRQHQRDLENGLPGLRERLAAANAAAMARCCPGCGAVLPLMTC